MSHMLGQEMLHSEDMDQDITGPSRKVNKSHLFAKKSPWAWKLQWRWNQKCYLEDILSFLKSPRTPKNVENWARYKLCKLSVFEEVHEEKYLAKAKNFQMGLRSYDLNLIIKLSMITIQHATPFTLFIYLFLNLIS